MYHGKESGWGLHVDHISIVNKVDINEGKRLFVVNFFVCFYFDVCGAYLDE